MRKPVLFFDADDTLWECNRFFRVIMHQFCDRIEREYQLDHNIVYQLILNFEHERLKEYGYGSSGFIKCLKDVYGYTSNEKETSKKRIEFNKWVDHISEPLIEFRIELIDGVSETLTVLKQRQYEMHMLTKGDIDEQSKKIKNSKIDHFFDNHHIFEHKFENEYLNYLNKYQLNPNQTIMIGNSPKSDILPCLNIGMRTIFIPHDSSWELEHADLPDHPNKAELKTFGQLLSILL